MARPKLEPHAVKNNISGPSTDLSIYNNVVITPDIEAYKNEWYREFLEPHKLEIPAYAMKHLYEAVLADDLSLRSDHLKRAREGMHLHYLAAWARGKIKVKDDDATPMPEDVKQQLRELNKQKREDKKTMREEHERASKQEKIYQQDLDKLDDKKKTSKRSKLPVFQDPDQQKIVLNKYPWALAGTFRQDPEKSGGTNVDIHCQVNHSGCTKIRTIHLADCFQVKACLNCKSKK